MSTEPPTYPMRPLNGGLLDHASNALRYEKGGWAFEPKFNGWRAIVNDRDRSMFNRHGQALSIGTEFSVALNKLKDCGGVCPWWDVEALERRHGIGKGSLILLDWIDVSDTGNRGTRYGERRSMMTEIWGEQFNWRDTPFDMLSDAVYAVPSFGYAEALKFWAEAPLINEMLGCTFYEGVIAKRVTSEYKVQLRSDEEPTMDWFKHRFTTQP